MNFFIIGFLIMQAARLACGTCVFDSDFGFSLNCNFKKSGLFRVRNLGGLKAHFGLGFSVGDELGFPESLGNVEGGRRRSIGYKNGPPPSLLGVLPATQQQQHHSPPDKRIISRSTGTLPQNAPPNGPQSMGPPRMVVKRPAALMPPPQSLMTEAHPLPLGVPAFRPIPKKTPQVQVAQRRNQNVIGNNAQLGMAIVEAPTPRVRLNNRLVDPKIVQSNRTFHVANPIVVDSPNALNEVPAFQAMPSSVARVTAVLSNDQNMATDRNDNIESRIANHNPQVTSPNYLQFEEPRFDLKGVSVEELAAAANVSVATIKHAIYVREQQLKAEHRAMLAAKLREEFIRTSTPGAPTIPTRTTAATVKPFVYLGPTAAVTGVEQSGTSFTHANQINVVNADSNKMAKVMNAPREYYPVGYDKNFDDNFKSKVDLPPTGFSCNKQKHFPGLYADTDLGCMVFHVCALTDDGLVRKSFLCPENTLFDQTILKCNWWFYVDCSSSKSIYDSNIPISKSYQLMKSLTYFSKYSKGGKNANESDDGATIKEQSDTGNSNLDLQTLRESVDGAARKMAMDINEAAVDDDDINPTAMASVDTPELPMDRSS